MTSDTPGRFNPDPDTFTPTMDADLTADPETGQGPGGEVPAPGAEGGDTAGAAGDVDATAGGNSAATSGTAASDEPSGGTGAGGTGAEAPGVGAPEKDPEDWVTGDEPMTGPQRSYLSTLAREAGEEVPDDITKAQASEMIDRLQSRTGRGTDN